jgi:SAM-dependent methyltransferase
VVSKDTTERSPEKGLVERARAGEAFEALYDERFEHGYMSEWPAWRRERIAALVRGFGLPSKGRALDFGCGQGVFTSVLRAALPEWEIVGTDLSTVGLREAARRVPDCTFVHGSETAQHGPFDFVFTHHVLEHVDDLDATVGFLTSLLTPRGQILHILPCGNAGSFEHALCALRVDGIDGTNGRFFFDEDGHVRRLTTKTLSQAAEAHGMVLARGAYGSQFWGALDWISGQELDTIRSMFDPAKAIDAPAGARLRRLRRQLMALRLLKRPPAILFRSAARDVLGREDWTWRDRAILTASNPGFLLAFPIRAALRALASREWARGRARENGSEMFLLFSRAPRSV